jgi:ABC-type spermidine/putrescine transport system permease subunit I
MRKFFSKPVALWLALSFFMSWGAAQLRDFLIVLFPAHRSLVDRGCGLTLVFALGIFVLRPLFQHFGVGAKDSPRQGPPGG